MVPLVAFGNNDLGGEFSQSDSLLTHVLGGIIVAEPCICWESVCDVWTLVSATHSFSHAKILTVLVMLHVALCCIRPVELHLLHYDAIGRYRLCRACYIINMLFFTISNVNIANNFGACNSDDGFREQRPRWGILPIRQFALACPCWYYWHYWNTLDNKDVE